MRKIEARAREREWKKSEQENRASQRWGQAAGGWGGERERDKSGLPYLSFSVHPCHCSYTTVQAFFQEIFLLPKKVLFGYVSCNYGLVKIFMHVFPHAVIENLNQIFAQANKRILHKIQSRRNPKVISSKKLLKAWVSSAKYYNECHL